MRRTHRLIRGPLAALALGSLVGPALAIALGSAPAYGLKEEGCSVTTQDGDTLNAVHGGGFLSGHSYTVIICSDGSRTYIDQGAPVIKTAYLSVQSTSDVVALLHRTTTFQFTVYDDTPGSTLGPQGERIEGSTLPPVVGTISAGHRTKGTHHLVFTLTPGGHTLSAGRYEMSLQALKDRQIVSSSAPLVFSVSSSGAITLSDG